LCVVGGGIRVLEVNQPTRTPVAPLPADTLPPVFPTNKQNEPSIAVNAPI
jgi:hypothetical protein